MHKQSEKMLSGIKALPSFPIVLVTVESNIMVAAAFHFYSFEPPSVMVGIKPEKHTFELITKRGEFGINIPTVNQLEKVKICGSISGKNVNKYDKAGLTTKTGGVIESLLIADCPVNLECKVVHEVEYNGSHRWFIGEIQAVHIKDNYVRDDALMFWLGQFRTVGDIIEGVHNKDIIK